MRNTQMRAAKLLRVLGIIGLVLTCLEERARGQEMEFEGKTVVHKESPTADEVLLDISVGATPTSVFTVDEDGDVSAKGSLTVNDVIQAADSGGLEIKNDGGTVGVRVKDSGTVVVAPSGGCVGVGTNDPESLLHLTSSCPGLRLEDSDDDDFIMATDYGKTYMQKVGDSWGAFVTLVLSTNRVGIGQSAPAAKLHIVGNNGTTGYPGTAGENAFEAVAGNGGAGSTSSSGYAGGLGGSIGITSGSGGAGGYGYAGSGGDGANGGKIELVSSAGGAGGNSSGYPHYPGDGGNGGNIELTTGPGGLKGGGYYGSYNGKYGNVVLVNNGGHVLVGTTAVPTYGDDPVLVFGDIGATPPTMGTNTAGIYADGTVRETPETGCPVRAGDGETLPATDIG